MTQDEKKILERLTEEFSAFVKKYDDDMRGDKNADNGGRRGIVENIRELRKNYIDLENKVSEMKKIEDDVRKNTQFRKTMIRIVWIIAGVILTVATYAAVSGLADSIASQ